GAGIPIGRAARWMERSAGRAERKGVCCGCEQLLLSAGAAPRRRGGITRAVVSSRARPRTGDFRSHTPALNFQPPSEHARGFLEAAAAIESNSTGLAGEGFFPPM